LRSRASDKFTFTSRGRWQSKGGSGCPEALFRELLVQRTDGSDFVFAAYTNQIWEVHAGNHGCLTRIKDEFTLENLGRWFYKRFKEWSGSHPQGSAYVHIFRKTALQLALDAEEKEEASKKVTEDAGATEGVLHGHYVQPKLWRKCNRTYRRLLDSAPSAGAERYGHVEDEVAKLERQIRAASEAQNQELVAALCVQLANKKRPETGGSPEQQHDKRRGGRHRLVRCLPTSRLRVAYMGGVRAEGFGLVTATAFAASEPAVLCISCEIL
jgi:hypothetical protein